MRVLVLGGGLMGKVAADDLIKDSRISQVGINDFDADKLENTLKLESEKLKPSSVDVSDHAALVKLIENFDVAINALPRKLSLAVLKAGIDAGTNIVDMTFTEKQLKLDDHAKSVGVIIIPGCGVAPGISNLLVKYGADKLDQITEAYIKVGGLPQSPEPPLGYKIVFNIETVWEQYVRKARVVRNGEIREVDPLTELETITFPEIGELECAITDGLGSLPYTMEGIKKMEEKTLRYPGHYQKIRTLIDCGLLNQEPIEINGAKIAPRRFLTKILSPKLELKEGEGDLTVMRVKCIGKKDGNKKTFSFDLIDYYDEKQNITSMARTTAFTSTIFARLLLTGKISTLGVIPPEEAVDPRLIFDELSQKNINIKETSN